MGATWGSLANLTAIFGVHQRPRFRTVGSRLYFYGRERAGQWTVLYWSDDSGVTWVGPFYPSTTTYTDTGYCDILIRNNGQIYMLTYAGNATTADIVEHVLTFRSDV
jgi:hypothetical protein